MIKKLLLCLLEVNTKELLGRTGHKCYVSGVYRSGNQYIPLSEGETFPPSSGLSVTWILVVSL